MMTEGKAERKWNCVTLSWQWLEKQNYILMLQGVIRGRKKTPNIQALQSWWWWKRHDCRSSGYLTPGTQNSHGLCSAHLLSWGQRCHQPPPHALISLPELKASPLHSCSSPRSPSGEMDFSCHQTSLSSHVSSALLLTWALPGNKPHQEGRCSQLSLCSHTLEQGKTVLSRVAVPWWVPQPTSTASGLCPQALWLSLLLWVSCSPALLTCPAHLPGYLLVGSTGERHKAGEAPCRPGGVRGDTADTSPAPPVTSAGSWSCASPWQRHPGLPQAPECAGTGNVTFYCNGIKPVGFCQRTLTSRIKGFWDPTDLTNTVLWVHLPLSFPF